MLKEYRLIPMRVDLNVVPPSINFEDALDLNNSNNSKQVYIDTVFHCDGLLLCTTKEDELVVWNPCSGETRWIKQNDGRRCFHRKKLEKRNPKFALGYENNKSCRNNKILMFWNRTYDQVDGFEIYEFNSNAWRVVSVPSCFVLASHGVNLKGNAYWNAFDDNIDYLLSFDFTRERFRRLCFPLSTCTSGDFIDMALSVVREELSVLRFIKDSSKIEMWVTNKMDTSEADLSWSKSFAVDYNFFVTASLLIDEHKKVALCCRYPYARICTIGEDKEYYAEIPFKNVACQLEHIFNYVPSLVQIQQDTEPDDVIT